MVHSLRVEELPERLRQHGGHSVHVSRAVGTHAAVRTHEVAVVYGARLRPCVEPDMGAMA